MEPPEGRRVAAEDLEEDDRAKAGRCRSRRGSAGEAAIADRRDARAEALVGADGGDRHHVVLVESLLAPDVHPDPGDERKAVPEPRVDRVLDV